MIFPIKHIRPNPLVGQHGFKRVFAWLPKRVEGYWIFLGYFEVLQIFVKFDYPFIDEEGKAHEITVFKWVDTNARLLRKNA